MRKIQNDVVMVNTNHEGPHTNTKPKQIQFGQHTILVRDWSDALRKGCDKIAEENQGDFHLVLDRIGWTRRPYFTKGFGHGYERAYKVGNTNIHVECNLAANNVKELLDAVSILFGYGRVKVERW